MADMLNQLVNVMDASREAYKKRYKSLYEEFVNACVLRSEGKVTIGAKEKARGALNEASYVLHDVYSLSDKEILLLEQEVEKKYGWSVENGFDKSIFN